MATTSTPTRTDFTLDVIGRYVCNGLDEALASVGGRPEARLFDVVIIGGGTFGAAVAEHLWFRDTHDVQDPNRRHRILVLEAGPMVLPEHVQNMPMLGLGTSGKATSIAELRAMTPQQQRTWSKEVWGLAWHSPTPFAGLAYCIGGRSLFWGGWSPRPLDSELPPDRWPPEVVQSLNTLYFDEASRQIGVDETNDFIYGALHNALRQVLHDGLEANRVPNAIPLGTLRDHPALAPGHNPSRDELTNLLGLAPGGNQPAQKLRDQLKLEAPLAVQGRAPRAGFFPFNKFSAVPLLIKAARSDWGQSQGDDVKRRLMIVPHCHVTRLVTTHDAAGWRVTGVETNQGFVPLPENGVVVIALGTIESTRLALASFEGLGLPHYDLIGQNLMAHLRSNLTIRLPRTAIANLPAAVQELQASALFVKGRDPTSGGHFHVQITAAGLAQPGADSEAELFKKVPDIDTLDAFRAATDQFVVITIRSIGEMEPRDGANPGAHPSRVMLDPGREADEYGVPRAFVTIEPTAGDATLWNAMDDAANEVAKVFAGNQPFEVLTPQGWRAVAPGANLRDVLPYAYNDEPDPTRRGRRDRLGTTHHEAGTLWMGLDPSQSVATPDGRFHDVLNVYVAGPALFPSVGSPNPMLTGIALARRLGDHLTVPPQPSAGFQLLFDGFSLGKWQMSTISGQPGRDDPGRFRVIDGALVAQPGTDSGLLWYTEPTPPNFILKLEWKRSSDDDNSGVFVRFPHPGSKGYNNTAFVAVDFGFEVQIDQKGAVPTEATGAIYGFAAPNNPQSLPVRPPGVWNEYEIEVVNHTYRVRLNGTEITTFTFTPESDAAHPDRALPSTAGSPRFIGLQAHTGPVAFRKIQLQPL